MKQKKLFTSITSFNTIRAYFQYINQQKSKITCKSLSSTKEKRLLTKIQYYQKIHTSFYIAHIFIQKRPSFLPISILWVVPRAVKSKPKKNTLKRQWKHVLYNYLKEGIKQKNISIAKDISIDILFVIHPQSIYTPYIEKTRQMRRMWGKVILSCQNISLF